MLNKAASLKQFLKQVRRRGQRKERPLVTVGYAQSIDGCIAATHDYPLRLSCQASLRLSHTIRAAHDAVLVGIGTVLADNPHLTVRHVKGRNPQPVILDSTLQYPLSARSLKNKRRPWIYTSVRTRTQKRQRLEAQGVQVTTVPRDRSRCLDLRAVLKHLQGSGIETVLVEGGAHVITSFFREKLVSHFVITIAPYFVGGVHAIADLMRPRTKECRSTSGFPQMNIVGNKRIGKDIVIWGNVV